MTVSEPSRREGETPTPFTSILERLVHGVNGSLGAVFTDHDGESVDYFSTMDPYELKVAGAWGSLMLQFVSQTRLDSATVMGISGSRLSLWICPLGERYTLTLVLDRRTWPPELEQALDRAMAELQEEAGLCPPHGKERT